MHEEPKRRRALAHEQSPPKIIKPRISFKTSMKRHCHPS
jgi:hypothetical protein